MENKAPSKDKVKKHERRKLNKKERATIILCTVFAVLLLITVWIVKDNRTLTVSSFSIKSARLPKAFDGYRIAHVSDLHNTTLGENNETLISRLRELSPDIIAMTGDIIDSYNPCVEISLAFVAEAVKIAPCYYVPGNHESRLPDEYEQFKSGLTKLGVTILENETVTLNKNGDSFDILGIVDPRFYRETLSKNENHVMEHLLDKHITGDSEFTLLLSHRPELFEIYSAYPIDLVLSGHAHGGQFRLPLIGGLFAPNQGAFPKYDAGLFEKNGTSMIVSRGLGNSSFPFRINNRPELVVIELDSVD